MAVNEVRCPAPLQRRGETSGAFCAGNNCLVQPMAFLNFLEPMSEKLSLNASLLLAKGQVCITLTMLKLRIYHF